MYSVGIYVNVWHGHEQLAAGEVGTKSKQGKLFQIVGGFQARFSEDPSFHCVASSSLL